MGMDKETFRFLGVARMRLDDDARIAKILDDIEPRVRGSLRALGVTGADVDDLFQNTCIKLHARGVFDEGFEASRIAFALKTAHSAAMDWFRAQRAQKRDPSRAATTALTDIETRTPEISVIARQSLDHLDIALSSLSDPQRQAFVLKHVDGLEAREIAERMRVPYNTARAYLETGLSRCRRVMRNLESPGNEDAPPSKEKRP